MKRILCLWWVFLCRPATAYEFEPDFWQRLVVTEVMVKPIEAAFQSGQWIEVHNPREQAFNLQGVVIATVRGGFHVVSPANPLMAEPGETVLLAPFFEGTNLPKGRVDYAYGGDFWLDTSEDIVLLLKAGQLLDVFAYGPDSIPVSIGASFSLESSETGTAKEWCYGRIPYDEVGDLGTPGQTNPDCDGDGDGFAEDQGDCDDLNPAVNPGAFDVCNGLDDDCDGLADDDAAPPSSLCHALGVCAGVEPICDGAMGWSCPYPETFEPEEVSCDGLDNDCDGRTDEDIVAPGPCLTLGVCAGVEPICDGAMGWSCPYPETFEPEEVSCDGLDNDCDGESDEGFGVNTPCTVGIGACARTGTWVCRPDKTGAECDVLPGLPTVERCGDDKDNDCDGETDEGFPVGAMCTVGTGICRTIGKYRCAEDALSVICSTVPGPPEPERCRDGLDNDCDGETDEDDCEPVGTRGGGCSSGRAVGGWSGPIGWLGGAVLMLVVGWRWQRPPRRPQSGRSRTE